MANEIKPLNVVALTRDIPERRLRRGQVGTVVEQLARSVFEIEFADNKGRTYVSAPLCASELIVLHYEPVEAI